MGDKRSHWAFDVLQNTPAFHLLLWPKLIFTCSWVWRWNFILISIHKYIHIYIHTYIFINPRSHVTITAISKRKTIKSNYSLWTNRQMRHLYTSNFNHLCGHILTLILSHKSFKRWSSHLCQISHAMNKISQLFTPKRSHFLKCFSYMYLHCICVKRALAKRWPATLLVNEKYVIYD